MAEVPDDRVVRVDQKRRRRKKNDYIPTQYIDDDGRDSYKLPGSSWNTLEMKKKIVNAFPSAQYPSAFFSPPPSTDEQEFLLLLDGTRRFGDWRSAGMWRPQSDGISGAQPGPARLRRGAGLRLQRRQKCQTLLGQVVPKPRGILPLHVRGADAGHGFRPAGNQRRRKSKSHWKNKKNKLPRDLKEKKKYIIPLVCVICSCLKWLPTLDWCFPRPQKQERDYIVPLIISSTLSLGRRRRLRRQILSIQLLCLCLYTRLEKDERENGVCI